MKTKQATKQRRQSRDFDVMSDLRSEFDELYDDMGVLDEVAMAEVEEWDD